MSYRSMRNWPPVWTRGYSANVKTRNGEIGILRRAVVYDEAPNRCYLVIDHEGDVYIGCLLFNDITFCRQIATLLQLQLGRSTKDIGDLNLQSTL